MNSTDIRKKIDSLNEEIAALVNMLRALYHEELNSLLEKHGIKKIRIRLNNHEFNDGSATAFNLYHEDLIIYFKNGEECQRSYRDENSPKAIIHKELRDFFEIFDTCDFYEKLYGDEYDYVIIAAK